MKKLYIKKSFTLAGSLALFVGMAQASEYYSPATLIADSAASMIYVAESTINLVDEIDVSSKTVSRTLVLPDSPTGLTLSSDDSTLYITAGAESGTVHVVDVASWQITTNVTVGHTPVSPVLSADGNTLFVCNKFNDSVAVIRLSDYTVIDEISVVRQPVSMALSASQDKLVVVNLLPAGAANDGFIACDVSLIDTTTHGVTDIPLLDGASGARDVCISPDGTYAYVTHLIGRYKLPTSQVERGWVWRNAFSIIDIGSGQLLNTVLLDETEMGAANPWGITCTDDGSTLCITHAGTHELSVIDRLAVHSRLASLPYPGGFSDTAADVPDDLGFLSDIRTRIQLSGSGPRDVVVIGTEAYVAEYYSDSIAVVDLTSNRVESITLGPQNPMTIIRRGEFYFNDANAGTFQKWLSCVSCHPDSRVDALNWDLANDGYGSPRNVKSMLLAHQTAPAMITGIRADAETAVRAGFKFIQFAIRDEAGAQAVDAYLSSMQPVSSPYRVKGQLSADAQAGKVLYQARCISCHSDQHYSNQSMHDVGTGRGSGEALDTPTLSEVWRTAPYLQDGRAATMQDVLK
jgi:YVTN family beta-propeller protein